MLTSLTIGSRISVANGTSSSPRHSGVRRKRRKRSVRMRPPSSSSSRDRKRRALEAAPPVSESGSGRMRAVTRSARLRGHILMSMARGRGRPRLVVGFATWHGKESTRKSGLRPGEDDEKGQLGGIPWSSFNFPGCGTRRQQPRSQAKKASTQIRGSEGKGREGSSVQPPHIRQDGHFDRHGRWALWLLMWMKART